MQAGFRQVCLVYNLSRWTCAVQRHRQDLKIHMLGTPWTAGLDPDTSAEKLCEPSVQLGLSGLLSYESESSRSSQQGFKTLAPFF